jgi:hypothetical protein
MVPSAVTLTDHPPRAVTICNTMRATCASGTGHGTVYTPIPRSRYHLRCHARNTCRWYRHRCPVSHTLWKLYRSPHCSSSCRQSTCTWYCDGTMYSTWSSWYQCGYHPSAHLTSCPQSACFRLRVTCVRALFHRCPTTNLLFIYLTGCTPCRSRTDSPFGFVQRRRCARCTISMKPLVDPSSRFRERNRYQRRRILKSVPFTLDTESPTPAPTLYTPKRICSIFIEESYSCSQLRS